MGGRGCLMAEWGERDNVNPTLFYSGGGLIEGCWFKKMVRQVGLWWDLAIFA